MKEKCEEERLKQFAEWLNGELGIDETVSPIVNLFQRSRDNLKEMIYNSEKATYYEKEACKIMNEIEEKCKNAPEILALCEKYENIEGDKWWEIETQIYERAIKDILSIWIEYEKIKEAKQEEKIETWKKDYNTKKIIDIKNALEDKEIKILKKLGIKVEDKMYTEYEKDIMEMELSEYYEEKPIKDLPSTGVKKEEFEALLEKFYSI